jgi:2,3-bisphosphoglycerate-independent phosphoglycerate mutase
MDRLSFLSEIAQKTESKIVLLVLDGVGDLRTSDQPRTALEAAVTPHLDELAGRSALGRLDPVLPGVTPGSGPGHLGLFGFDPTEPEIDIGRGVLEALGLGLDIPSGGFAARGNFASVDEDGKLTDRRAGRIPTEECERLCARLAPVLAREAAELSDGLEVTIHPGEGYRFVLLVGPGTSSAQLSAAIEDTDPQRLGVEPLPLQASLPPGENSPDPATTATIARLQPVVDRLRQELEVEPKANSFLLRGFSKVPSLPTFPELYQLTPGCFAGYPLYRGVASLAGMKVVECGKRISDLLDQVERCWNDHDFFFLHVKQTDQAGEDGDLATKVAVLEEVDQQLPRLLALKPDVIAITGDHSTPAPMKAHSWHPIPLLLHGRNCFIDDCQAFDEAQCIHGHVGTVRSCDLMGLMLGNAGKLRKFGA